MGRSRDRAVNGMNRVSIELKATGCLLGIVVLTACGVSGPVSEIGGRSVAPLSADTAAMLPAALEGQLYDAHFQLQSVSPDHRAQGALIFEQLGTRATPALAALEDSLHDPAFYVGTRAAIALSRIGEQALPHLQRALGDAKAQVRELAALAVGRMGQGGNALAEPIAALLRDEDVDVRDRAAHALAQLDADVALSLLRQQMLHPRVDVRAAATYGLKWLGRAAAPAQADLIAALIPSEHVSVRTSAAAALGNIGESGITELCAMLDSGRPLQEHEMAAFALQYLHRKAARPLARVVLESVDEATRLRALAILERIGPRARKAERLLSVVQADVNLSPAMVEALASTLAALRR